MKVKQWKYIFASLAFVIILIPSGCKVTESTYRKVATDTKVTSEKKAIIAPWVTAYFPIRETIIPGKVSSTIDTVHESRTVTDTLTNETRIIDVQYIVRNNVRVDTFKTEDYSKILLARREITQLQADIITQESLRRQAESNQKKVTSQKRNLIFVIIGLCVLLLGSIYLHFKR